MIIIICLIVYTFIFMIQIPFIIWAYNLYWDIPIMSKKREKLNEPNEFIILIPFASFIWLARYFYYTSNHYKKKIIIESFNEAKDEVYKMCQKEKTNLEKQFADLTKEILMENPKVDLYSDKRIINLAKDMNRLDDIYDNAVQRLKKELNIK